MPNSKRGTVATIAVIALLVAVVGIGIANFFYIDSSRVQIETTVSTTTVTGPPVTKTKTDTQTTTNTVVNTMTAYSSTTLTTVSVSDKVVTPSTTVTIVQTSGNITQITSSEAVLYSGIFGLLVCECNSKSADWILQSEFDHLHHFSDSRITELCAFDRVGQRLRAFKSG